MRWTGFVALGVAVVLQQAAGVASAAPASRERVRSVLRGHERVHLTAADWRRLGDDVDVHLVEAAADRRLVFGARQRALSALGTVGGARAKEFLHRFLTARDVSAPLLSAAIQAYARGFGKDEPEEGLRLAVPLLGHADWQVRRGAVRALGALGGEGARVALRAQQSRETHPAVGSAIRSALREGPPAR
jgi:HEAT repeat protein